MVAAVLILSGHVVLVRRAFGLGRRVRLGIGYVRLGRPLRLGLGVARA